MAKKRVKRKKKHPVRAIVETRTPLIMDESPFEPIELTKTGGRPQLWTLERIEQEAAHLIEWITADEKNLWIQDFAFQRGFWPSRIHEFDKLSKCFSAAHQLLNEVTAKRLLNKGLEKEYDASLVRFYLINKAGFISESTKAQIDSRTQADINITINEIV